VTGGDGTWSWNFGPAGQGSMSFNVHFTATRIGDNAPVQQWLTGLATFTYQFDAQAQTLHFTLTNDNTSKLTKVNGSQVDKSPIGINTDPATVTCGPDGRMTLTQDGYPIVLARP
jgi:hypothetical protein